LEYEGLQPTKHIHTKKDLVRMFSTSL